MLHESRWSWLSCFAGYYFPTCHYSTSLAAPKVNDNSSWHNDSWVIIWALVFSLFFNKRHQGNVSDATRRGLANTPRGGGGGGLHGRSRYTDSIETTWLGMAPVRAVVASSALPSASGKTLAYRAWHMTAHLAFLLLLLYRGFQYLPLWDKFRAIFTSPKKNASVSINITAKS